MARNNDIVIIPQLYPGTADVNPLLFNTSRPPKPEWYLFNGSTLPKTIPGPVINVHGSGRSGTAYVASLGYQPVTYANTPFGPVPVSYNSQPQTVNIDVHVRHHHSNHHNHNPVPATGNHVPLGRGPSAIRTLGVIKGRGAEAIVQSDGTFMVYRFSNGRRQSGELYNSLPSWFQRV